MASLLRGDGDVSPESSRALSPFQAVIAYTKAAELVRGLARAAPDAQVVSRPPLPPPSGPHAARWLAEAVAAFGGDPSVTPPLLVASEEEAAAARPWLDRLGPDFLAIHPGSGSPRKNWPADRFASLIEARATGGPWLLVEGPADGAATDPLRGRPNAVLARELPVRLLGVVLAKGGLYVGNDSGVTHLAAAFGAPTLALFGPTDPAQWAPIGTRVTVVRSGDRTMEGLGTDEAVRAAREIQDRSSPSKGK
jgi:heptosyltransferase-2